MEKYIEVYNWFGHRFGKRHTFVFHFLPAISWWRSVTDDALCIAWLWFNVEFHFEE